VDVTSLNLARMNLYGNLTAAAVWNFNSVPCTLTGPWSNGSALTLQNPPAYLYLTATNGASVTSSAKLSGIDIICDVGAANTFSGMDSSYYDSISITTGSINQPAVNIAYNKFTAASSNSYIITSTSTWHCRNANYLLTIPNTGTWTVTGWGLDFEANNDTINLLKASGITIKKLSMGIQNAKLTIKSASTTLFADNSTAPSLVLLVNDTIVNNNTLTCSRSQSGYITTVGAGAYFDGTGTVAFKTSATGISDSIPALTGANTLSLHIQPKSNSTTSEICMMGSILGFEDIELGPNVTSGIITYKFLCDSVYSYTNLGLYSGANSGNRAKHFLGSTRFLILGDIDSVVAGLGNDTIQPQSSQIHLQGNMHLATNVVWLDSAKGKIFLEGGVAKEFKTRNYQFNDIEITKTGSVVDSLADTLKTNILTRTSGYFKTKTSDIIVGDSIAILGTDSAFISSKIKDSGNLYLAAAQKIAWFTGYDLYMCGTGTQVLTGNGNILLILKHTNSGTLRPADSQCINNLLDSSTGLWDMDYGLRCSTAVWSAACSLAQSGRMEVMKNLTYGLDVKENVTGALNFIGGVSGIFSPGGNTVHDINVNKAGAGIGLTVSSTGTGNDLTCADGNVWIDGGDTLKIVDGTFNAADSIARSGTGRAYIQVSGNFSTVNTALWDTAIVIIATSGSHTFTLNGNPSLPRIINKGKITWQ
jgi:hypothetical protein